MKKRALISVSDKTGILEFAKALVELKFEIVSTGGSASYLSENGVKVTLVSDTTKFPEILGGRVKTLHPNIHGGILADQTNREHLDQLQQYEIQPFHVVCVNLYPFVETISNPSTNFNDAIENIDIGGVALIRAAAKNHNNVLIITTPSDYASVIKQLEAPEVSSQFKLELASKAFLHTANYDTWISDYLLSKLNSSKVDFPQELTINNELLQVLRYGENGHQKSALYKDHGNIEGLMASYTQIQGKELSYNNIADGDCAWECVKQFTIPSCVIVKHANPCAVANDSNSLNAYLRAFQGDPISSFGGIIAFNTEVDLVTANALMQQFAEVIIAPSYTQEALEVFSKKSALRILQIKLNRDNHNQWQYLKIGGGMLIQSPENKALDFNAEVKLVTDKDVDAKTKSDLEHAWMVAKFVKSNAIVLVKDGQTIGIGAGQMSRVDSAKIAINKAKEFGFDLNGAVCASDGFFPFADGVELLGEQGIKAIIQPGGSIRDKEVIECANKFNISMMVTGYRIFRH